MASYAFLGRGASLPYQGDGVTVLKRKIDLPAIIAGDYAYLSLAATPTVALTSLSQFTAADVLELWEVPAWTHGLAPPTIEGSPAVAGQVRGSSGSHRRIPCCAAHG